MTFYSEAYVSRTPRHFKPRVVLNLPHPTCACGAEIDFERIVREAAAAKNLRAVELETMLALFKGMPTTEIGLLIGKTHKGIKHYIQLLFRAFGVPSRPKLFHKVMYEMCPACPCGVPVQFDAIVNAASEVVKLPPRQHETLVGLFAGMSNEEVGAALGIDRKTVKSHRERLFVAFDVESLAELFNTVFPL